MREEHHTDEHGSHFTRLPSEAAGAELSACVAAVLPSPSKYLANTSPGLCLRFDSCILGPLLS